MSIHTKRMREYNHKKIEEKWQKKWKETNLYRTEDDPKKPKSYVLDMFPYPSGEGLHVGHPKGYIATDVYSRMKHMRGFNVLHPMGWDAFGLPAEQYAIKNKVHPRIAVEKNIRRFKEQLEKIGFNYDWEREVNTTDPEFYKWTQWIFKQLFKKGLAHESYEPINWCPVDKTGLSNEDLDGNRCERCGSIIEKKLLRQWKLQITKYADRMLEGLEKLDWPESIKESQRNWIGKSEGAEIEFVLNEIPGQADGKHKVKVFTTRPDTLFGATYLAISYELAEKWIDIGWQASYEVKKFVTTLKDEEAARESTFEEIREKKGIATGFTATNPANGEKIPVWIANYVLSGYGTGAIMAVPAHDERDFEFAQNFKLKVIEVVKPTDGIFRSSINMPDFKSFTGPGTLVNSGDFNNTQSERAKNAITKAVGGELVSQYRLKDWVFARQRYWGEPFPIVFDADHKPYVVADSELPVVLPEVEAYEPTGTGESPLANIREWVEVYGKVNKDGEFVTLKKSEPGATLFTRETNTMPQWAGSSWYYLRYIDPKNSDALIDKAKDKKWSPVDLYVGGAEHATRHLIYARFWHKFLFDLGVVSYDEPFMRLQNVGLIQAEDGRKMSKRWGNVINPDDVIDKYGADTLRLYEMFMGPFDQPIAWSTDNMMGGRRFIERVWRLSERVSKDSALPGEVETLLHQTIKKVGDDIEMFGFNTAISQLMICVGQLEKLETLPVAAYEIVLKLIAPFVPHVAEELWGELGHTTEIYHQTWPTFDPGKILSASMTIAVQVNGKLRDTVTLLRDANEEAVTTLALASSAIKKWTKCASPKRIIYVKGKIINIIL